MSAPRRTGTRPGSATAELGLVCLLPLLALIEFDLIGRMLLAEVVLLLGLPFLLFRYGQRTDREWRMSRSAWTTLVLGALWLSALILSDLYRGSTFRDFSRGWAKVGFFLGLFLVLQLILRDRPWPIVAFALGLEVVTPIKPFLYQSADEVLAVGGQALWKFRFAAQVIALAAIAFCLPRLRRRLWIGALVMGSIGALNMLMGSRSSALVAMIIAAALYATWDYESARAQGRPWTGISVLLALGLASGITLALYQLALRQTLIETDLHERHEKQSESKLGLLIGGRSEVLYALMAIRDSPLIGYGSWAKSEKYAHLDLSRFGVDDHRPYDEGTVKEDLIPTHSHIFGAWVEAGLPGGIFWLRLFVLVLALLVSGFRKGDPIWPLTAFTAISLVWSLPFSPFGFEGRLRKAFEMVVVLSALRRGREQTAALRAVPVRSLRVPPVPRLAGAGVHSITHRRT